MRCYTISFLVTAVLLASVSAQEENFMKNLNNMMQGQRSNVKNKILDKYLREGDFEKSKFNASTRYKIKNALTTGDFSGINSSMILNFVPEKMFASIKPEVLLNMKQKEQQNFLEYGTTIAGPKFTEWLRILIDTNVNKKEAIAKLQNVLGSSTSKSTIQLLLSRLGDPEMITKQNITEDLRNILFRLPNKWLMKIEDEDAIAEILRMSDMCITGSTNVEKKSTSCPTPNEVLGVSRSKKAIKMEDTRYWAMEELYDADELTAGQFSKMELDRIPPEFLIDVDGKLLAERQTDIAILLTKRQDLKKKYGRRLAKKIMEEENFEDIRDTAEMEAAMRKLGGTLNTFVEPSDVDTEALKDTTVLSTIKRNAQNAIKNEQFNAKSMKSMARYYRSLRGDIPATDIMTMGPELVSALDAGSIKAILKADVLNKEQVKNLCKYIELNGGAAKEGKLRQAMDKMKILYQNSDGIDMNSFPRTMISMLNLNEFSKFSDASTIAFFNKDLDMQPAIPGTLIKNMAANQLYKLPPNGKSHIPISKIQYQSSAVKEQIAQGLPSTSPLAKLAVDATVGKKTELTTYDFTKENLVKFMTQREVNKIKRTDMMDIIKLTKNIAPTLEFCYSMKEIFVNMSATDKMSTNDLDSLLLLNPNEIEDMPPCVIAAFGSGAIKELDKLSKQVLYDKLTEIGHVYDTTGTPRPVAETIIAEGLKATNTKKLMVEDLDQLGDLAVLAPANLLKTVNKNALPAFLEKLNILAQSAIMPCLDNGRIAEIRALVFKYMGSDISQWTNASPISCLLFTMSDAELGSIDDATMCSATCGEKKNVHLYETLTDIKDIECKAEGRYQNQMKREKKVKQRQELACLNTLDVLPKQTTSRRKKRAINDIPTCDKSYVNGVNTISTAELQSITEADITNCLGALCKNKMDVEKAKLITGKLINTLKDKEIKNINKDQLENLEFCMKGLSKSDIKAIPKLNDPDYKNVVASMGATGAKSKEFSEDQKKAVAAKVRDTYKSGGLATWTTPDILMANELICSYNETEIGKFQKISFKDAIPTLGLLDCKLEPQGRALLSKAKEGLGQENTWTSATVAELNNIVAGINAEEMMNIYPDAFSGLTASCMKKLPDNVAQLITKEQIMNLPSPAALAVSTVVKDSLSPEKLEALTNAKSGRKENNANVISIHIAVIIAFAAIPLLW